MRETSIIIVIPKYLIQMLFKQFDPSRKPTSDQIFAKNYPNILATLCLPSFMPSLVYR